MRSKRRLLFFFWLELFFNSHCLSHDEKKKKKQFTQHANTGAENKIKEGKVGGRISEIGGENGKKKTKGEGGARVEF